jgi:hypothetical protein
MKETPGKIFIVALLLLILTGCRKDYDISDKQAILFQFEYVNYAWGYQHFGFIIDNEGNVLKYSNPDDWNFPDNDLIISESLVAQNLSKCIKISNKIPNEELQKYSKYINNIASSKVTALKNVAADAGSYDFICYQFSENTNSYKGYLIKKEGDFTCENLNFYAKRVLSWMKEIEAGISDF